MHQRPTNFGNMAARSHYQGGVSASGTLGLKGGQPLQPARNPSNWYPVNLPAAAGTPTDSQCKFLVSELAQFVAEEVIRQSVMLPLVYRYVQTNVTIPAASVTATLPNGATGTGAMVASGSYDGFGEAVPVDVVIKNPALTYDLGVRLAAQLAQFFDSKLLSLSASWTPAFVGVSGTPITRAVITSGIAAVPNTGEPLFLVTNPAAFAAMTIPAAYPALPTFIDAATEVEFNPHTFEFPNAPGVLGAAQQLPRVFSSPMVPTGPPVLNQLFTPSGLALVTFDIGSNLSMLTGITPPALSGNGQIATSVARDPQTGQAQLVVQVCMGNTGSGVQTVYLNAGYAPVCAVPANGVIVRS